MGSKDDQVEVSVTVSEESAAAAQHYGGDRHGEFVDQARSETSLNRSAAVDIHVARSDLIESSRGALERVHRVDPKRLI